MMNVQNIEKSSTMNVNLKNTCRTCLRNDSHDIMIPVFEDTDPDESVNHSLMCISEELSLLQLKIKRDDGFPQQLCIDCMGKLTNVSTFRIICLRSQAVLNKYYRHHLIDKSQFTQEQSNNEKQSIDTDEFKVKVETKNGKKDVRINKAPLRCNAPVTTKINVIPTTTKSSNSTAIPSKFPAPIPANKTPAQTHSSTTTTSTTLSKTPAFAHLNRENVKNVIVTIEKVDGSNRLLLNRGGGGNGKDAEILCNTVNNVIYTEIDDNNDDENLIELKNQSENDMEQESNFNDNNNNNSVNDNEIDSICNEDNTNNNDGINNESENYEIVYFTEDKIDEKSESTGKVVNECENDKEKDDDFSEDYDFVKEIFIEEIIDIDGKVDDDDEIKGEYVEYYDKDDEHGILNENDDDFVDDNQSVHFNVIETSESGTDLIVNRITKHKQQKKCCSFNCIYCDASFNSEKLLKQHQNGKCSLIKIRTCRFCEEVLDTVNELRDHITTFHSNDRPHKCIICKKGFARLSYLNLHMVTHDKDFGQRQSDNEEQSYQCEICDISFSHKEALIIHLRTHCKTHSCSVCNLRFEKPIALKHHYLSVHGIRMISVGKQKDTIKLKPNVMNAANIGEVKPNNTSHRSKSKLKKRTAAQYSCPLCNKAFMVPSSLESHMKVHEQVRKHACTICGNTFKRAEHLRIHINGVHLKHKPYECTECGQRFSQAGDRNVHMRRHINEKPYVCKYCDRTFRLVKALRSHVRIHTGEKPFKCSVCNLDFISYASLANHTKRSEHQELENQKRIHDEMNANADVNEIIYKME